MTAQAKPNIMHVDFLGETVLFDASTPAARWRVETLADKEPDTLAWLSQLKPGEVFVDIGANVGMYSLLAAKARGLRVYAFEPESQNYALLNRNIYLNGVKDSATAYCVALSDATRIDQLFLSQFEPGGSCHQFGIEADFNLKPARSSFRQGCVAFSLDALVEAGAIPAPDHIKIDVDGLEHVVIKGCLQTLKNPGVKSVLVEINGSLPQHIEILEKMLELGFRIDQRQVDVAMRTEGAFQGCGNIIFWRESAEFSLDFSTLFSARERDVLAFMVARIEEATLETAPYPHYYIPCLFPADFYQQILRHRMLDDYLKPIGDSGRTPTSLYHNRAMLKLTPDSFRAMPEADQAFWRSLTRILSSHELLSALAGRFGDHLGLNPRLAAGEEVVVIPENLLIRDRTRYMIGPHTDAPHRLLSVMIYLPQDDSLSDLGTSIYVPNDPTFTCEGGPHYAFKGFRRVKTACFLPNTALCFLKTNNSFHGVETITAEDVERDAICYIARFSGATACD
jgi:FkbM family methyltransferase